MIEIHTLRWRGDRAIAVNDERTDGHLPTDLTIWCRVKVDGVEIPNVTRARVRYANDDFSQVTLLLHGEVETINHTKESWEELDGRV